MGIHKEPHLCKCQDVSRLAYTAHCKVTFQRHELAFSIGVTVGLAVAEPDASRTLRQWWCLPSSGSVVTHRTLLYIHRLVSQTPLNKLY